MSGAHTNNVLWVQGTPVYQNIVHAHASFFLHLPPPPLPHCRLEYNSQARTRDPPRSLGIEDREGLVTSRNLDLISCSWLLLCLEQFPSPPQYLLLHSTNIYVRSYMSPDPPDPPGGEGSRTYQTKAGVKIAAPSRSSAMVQVGFRVPTPLAVRR